jgi:hypothetical protein
LYHQLLSLYFKFLPKWYEVLPGNIGKAMIEPSFALLTKQDITLFGSNIVATSCFRDLTLASTMSINYLLGNVNSATNTKYCGMDIVGMALKISIKFMTLAPHLAAAKDHVEEFSLLARNTNFITEPLALFINKAIRERGDQPINGIKYLVEQAKFSWLAEVLLGGVIRSAVADQLGEMFKYLKIDHYLFKPVYQKLDQLMFEHLYNVSTNATDATFVSKIAQVQSFEHDNSLQQNSAYVFLFSSNVIYGLMKESLGWFMIAPVTRFSYSVWENTLKTYPQMHYPSVVVAALVFFNAGLETHQAFTEQQVTKDESLEYLGSFKHTEGAAYDDTGGL